MDHITRFAQKHPAVFGALAFGLLSLLLNTLWIMTLQMAHVYDIVHVLPSILIIDALLPMMGGIVTSQFVFVPIGVLMDALLGVVIGWLTAKYAKTPKQYFLSISLIFAIYWIVVTYQWLPMFG